MGQHDPLDGYVTCIQLEETAARLSGAHAGPSLERAIEELGSLSEAMDVRTTDPLGLGGLLTDAYRVVQLASAGALEGGNLLAGLLGAALDGLARSARQDDWRADASRRLAFRELGLAIGLAAIELFEDRTPVRGLLAALREYVPLGRALESFWLEPAHRQTSVWSEHRDINEVMLATRLAPRGYLVLIRLAAEA
jgi:hypothetical protein